MVELESPPKASDFMQTDVQTVTAEMTLDEVVQHLLKHGLSNAPVVVRERIDGPQRLIGFISERDCLSALAQESFFGSPAPQQTARTVMRGSPACVTPETDLFAVAAIFINHHYRHLPVTENGHLLGMVSRRDVLRAVDDYYRKYGNAKLKERFHPDTHLLMYHRFMSQ